MNPESIAKSILSVIQKANEVGVAVEAAVKVLCERLFTSDDDAMKSSGAYEAMPAEMQAAVDEAVASAQS